VLIKLLINFCDPVMNYCPYSVHVFSIDST